MKTTKKLSMGRGVRGKKVAAVPRTSSPVVAGRVPRITKLMALAIKFDQMIRDGAVKDQAQLSRLGFVTRARVTQIMNLLNVAPEIQCAILNLPTIARGKDPVTERDLRALSSETSWQRQGRMWAERRKGQHA